MSVRLTREQMASAYPNRWLGLKNVEYQDDDGVTLVSAEVVYTTKSRDVCLKMDLFKQLVEAIRWTARITPLHLLTKIG